MATTDLDKFDPTLVEPVETTRETTLVEPVETTRETTLVEPVETTRETTLVEPVETTRRTLVEPVETKDLDKLDQRRWELDQRNGTLVEPVETKDLDKLDQRNGTLVEPVETTRETTLVEPVETKDHDKLDQRNGTLVEPVETKDLDKLDQRRWELDQRRWRVLVAALTYRRPDDIAELAPQLVRHAIRATNTDFDGVGFAVEVLVVDNDPAASARPALEQFEGVRYVHEPRPGIAAARNRALTEGRDADLLVFIDDDERPQDGWLTALLRTWAIDRPAAVSGHVLSLFPDNVDPWIRAGDLFARPNPPTGTRLRTLAAGNLLLDLRHLRRWDIRFDDRFGLTGGEDTLLTRQIDAAGGRMVWCRESVTTDRVPAERLTRRWLARRFFRFGVTAVRVELALVPRGRRRAVVRVRAIGGGTARIAVGGARWAVGLLAHRLADRARGCRTLLRGAGLVAGACGHDHVEYARTEPPR